MKSIQKIIDKIEGAIGAQPQVECPLVNVFTPGLYLRQVFIPAGTILTSKIHKTQHPYIVSMGKISVFDEGQGEVLIQAPFMGVTQAGTRRVLYAHEDTIWTTAHANPEDEDLEQIEERIIQKHENKFLTNRKELIQ